MFSQKNINKIVITSIVFFAILALNYNLATNNTSPNSKLHHLDSTAQTICTIHQENNGATYSLLYGNMAGTNMYAVSVFPDLGVVLPQKTITIKQMELFIQANLLLLQDSQCCIGTWFNSEDGNTYIDITAILSDKEQAISLGKKYNQIAIWDLKNENEIMTGGSGEPLQDLPPPINRLPKAK